ncbi:MAG TPA: hypothetical protein PKE55_00470 [Kiritimatiellia bacterium]|nr:hypothetical protein [Kiritimatiellia bacterium]
MIWVVLVLGLIMGGVAQGLLPLVEWAGHSPLPLLGGLVVYYSLMHRRVVLLTAASVAGLLQDSLSLMPLGYSSLCFCVIALVIEQFRDVLLVDLWTTHGFLGGVANLTTVVLTYLFLLNDGLSGLPVWFLASKAFGSILLGAVTAPLVFWVLHGLDRMTGFHPVEREGLL